MLIEIYILIQIVTLLLLAACFVVKTPLASVLTAFFSGVLIVGSWVIRMPSEYVWSSDINAYVSQPVYVQTPYLPYINIAVFALALLFFVYDMFIVAKDESEGPNSNSRLNGGGVGLK